MLRRYFHYSALNIPGSRWKYPLDSVLITFVIFHRSGRKRCPCRHTLPSISPNGSKLFPCCIDRSDRRQKISLHTSQHSFPPARKRSSTAFDSTSATMNLASGKNRLD